MPDELPNLLEKTSNSEEERVIEAFYPGVKRNRLIFYGTTSQRRLKTILETGLSPQKE